MNANYESKFALCPCLAISKLHAARRDYLALTEPGAGFGLGKFLSVLQMCTYGQFSVCTCLETNPTHKIPTFFSKYIISFLDTSPIQTFSIKSLFFHKARCG